MLSVDLNCDLGEGIGNDAAIMPFISSANISCGYHAGEAESIIQTVILARQNGVAVGAHPSFADRANFGRTEMKLSNEEIYELVSFQIQFLSQVCNAAGTLMLHVKPHGALYNMSARNPSLARTIAEAIKDFDATLFLFGLSGSCSISEAKSIGLKTASEVFADRSYQDDGSLTPRNQPGALIEKPEQAAQQALQMVQKRTVNTVQGKQIPILAETICLHGDNPSAIAIVKAIHDTFSKENITIQSNRF